MAITLGSERYDLDTLFSPTHLSSNKAVRLQCLDRNKENINGAYATGVIVEEDEGHYLYTCWHVVTGIDPERVKIDGQKPIRVYV